MNLKEIEGLQKRKNREETGCFFLEGLRACKEAFASGAEIVQLVVTEDFCETDEWKQFRTNHSSANTSFAELDLLKVGKKNFARLSDTVTPQGIGAVVKMPKADIGAIDFTGKRFGIVIAENLQDPGNMGTIIRTADAAGFAAIICSKDTVDVCNPKVLRSTVGSMFRFPIIQTDFTGAQIADMLKKQGCTVVAAHPRGGESLFEATFGKKYAVAIGNEANGLSDELLNACDKTITIPMPGGTESLNASVAAALMMYEVRRKGE